MAKQAQDITLAEEGYNLDGKHVILHDPTKFGTDDANSSRRVPVSALLPAPLQFDDTEVEMPYKWVDGKQVYSKVASTTFNYNAASLNQRTIMQVPSIDSVVRCLLVLRYASNAFSLPNPQFWFVDGINHANGNIGISRTNAADNHLSDGQEITLTLVIEYTKTS